MKALLPSTPPKTKDAKILAKRSGVLVAITGRDDDLIRQEFVQSKEYPGYETAQCLAAASPFGIVRSNRALRRDWRGGRVVEGARLERV